MATTITIGPYSAYAIAVKHGYTGTEEEWINSVETARKSAEKDAAQAHTDMLTANETLTVIRNLQNDWLLSAYPVGSIFMSTDAASPASLFGGTWEKVAEDRALMGASSSHAAGSTAEAGLPNIVGKASFMCYMAGAEYTNKKRVNGFLTAELLNNTAADVSHPSNGNQMWLNTYVTLDASTYSSIYGNSSTVQPPAYFTNVWRRIK